MKKYDTTTRITNFNIDWQKIKSACMTTISKKAGDKEPPKEWKRKLLICRHSPREDFSKLICPKCEKYLESEMNTIPWRR